MSETELLQVLVEEVRAMRAAMELNGTGKPKPEYITRTEAATMLHCSLPTLDKLRAQGRLPWAKPGSEVLIDRNGLERYMHEEFQASIR